MNSQELWQTVLGEIELSVSKASFTTWFKNTAITELNEEEVLVSVPNIFAKEWLEKKFKKAILQSIQSHFPRVNRMNCVVGGYAPIESTPKKIDSAATMNKSTISPQAPAQAPVLRNQTFRPQPPSDQNGGFLAFSNLNPRYNFNTYVVGTNNELAYAACRSVMENPGKNYNPLFIYGGVGLGKTHLLQSTGNGVQTNFPGMKVRYLSMERFANELVDAIQNSKAKEFKNKYIALDVLILDDVQFLSGREKTQEEFFHVFESLYQLGKQIILSSDRPPKSIATLEDRLRSRFEGGMIADVGKPDLETRIAIINKKIEEKKFFLAPEITAFLAENIHHNVRELEGALNKIIVTYQLRNRQPLLEEIVEMTKDIISTSHRKKDLLPDRIIKVVSEYFNLRPDEVAGRCRKKKVVKPRQIAIYFLRKDIHLSYPEIGEILGGRDHSTAIYAYEKISLEIDTNQQLSDQIKFIREKFVEY